MPQFSELSILISIIFLLIVSVGAFIYRKKIKQDKRLLVVLICIILFGLVIFSSVLSSFLNTDLSPEDSFASTLDIPRPVVNVEAGCRNGQSYLAIDWSESVIKENEETGYAYAVDISRNIDFQARAVAFYSIGQATNSIAPTHFSETEGTFPLEDSTTFYVRVAYLSDVIYSDVVAVETLDCSPVENEIEEEEDNEVDGSDISICGNIDVNGDEILTIIDFAEFAKFYGASCSNDFQASACGSKDVDGNEAINLVDFASFARRYGGETCRN